MKSDVIKPRKLFYGISAFVLVGGIILFVVVLIAGIFSTMEKMNNQIVVPGNKIVELKETGKYSIFFEHRSVVDGKVYETSNINGLLCTLKNTETGELVKLNNTLANSNYSMSGREGKSIFDFEIDKAGKYEINAEYEDGDGEEAVLVIGKGFFGALVTTILISIGILFVSFGISLTIFLVTLIKRKKHKNTMLMQQNPLN